MSPIPPPKRRNGQIRTYCRLIQFALTQQLITNTCHAKELYAELQAAKARIDRNTQDKLNGVDVEQLVQAAQALLGFEGGPSQ